MKFLIISRDFPYIKGGVSDYTYFLSKTLSKKVDVFVLTSYDERVNKNIKDFKVLPVVEKWGFKGLNEILNFIDSLKPNWIILQYVPYMYSHFGIPFWLIFLYLILKKKKYKICTMFHEVRILALPSKPKYILVAIFQKIIAFFISLFSSKIIINTEFWKKLLGYKDFDKKIKVIPVGSNIIPEKKVFENKKRKDEILIGSFGGAKRVRRIHLHLKAAKILKDRGINVKYLFIGEVPFYYKKLARKLNVDAEFTGHLKKEEAYNKLKELDFFIFFNKYSNKYEAGISLNTSSIASAFSANVPIISNKGVLTDKILNGYYIECKPSEFEIADKIMELIKNPEKIKEIKEKMDYFYKEYISWEKIGGEYIKFLLEDD